MKTIVFIDGENFRHKLAEVLKAHKRIKNSQELKKFDVRGLVSELIPEYADPEIGYFGAKVAVLGKQRSTRQKTTAIIQQKRAWNSILKEQGIHYFEVGMLRLRDSNQKDGSEYLVEKGVDVGMAVDMLVEALSRGTERIVFVSSDTDILPAVMALKSAGIDTTYIAHDTFIIPSLAYFSTRTRVFSDTQIIKFLEYKNTKKVV